MPNTINITPLDELFRRNHQRNVRNDDDSPPVLLAEYKNLRTAINAIIEVLGSGDLPGGDTIINNFTNVYNSVTNITNEITNIINEVTNINNTINNYLWPPTLVNEEFNGNVDKTFDLSSNVDTYYDLSTISTDSPRGRTYAFSNGYIGRKVRIMLGNVTTPSALYFTNTFFLYTDITNKPELSSNIAEINVIEIECIAPSSFLGKIYQRENAM